MWKRKWRCWGILLLCCLSVFSTHAFAAGIDTGKLKDSLPSEASQHLGDYSPTDTNAEKGMSRLFSSALEKFRTELRSATAGGFIMVGICVLVSIGSGFVRASGMTVSQKVMDMTAVCAMMGVCFTSLGNILTDCSTAVKHLGTFSQVLIPVFAAASAVSGKPVSAVASAGSTLFFSGIIIQLSLSIFIPGLYLYIIMNGAGIVSENTLLERTAGLCKGLIITFLKGFLMAFTGYISLSGMISGSVDAATVKTAGAAISGVVPILGSIIANASEALLSGAAILRSSVGIFGLLGACAICLTPFIRALTHMLVFKILAAVSASFAGGSASKMLTGISNAYGVALGILGACSAVLFISIVVSTVVCRV